MKIEGFERFHEAVAQYADRYRSDEAVRARIAGGDTSDLGIDVPEGMEVRIVEQTADTFYFPLPPDPNQTLSDKALEAAAGGRGGRHGDSGQCVVMMPCMPCAPDVCLST